MTTTKSSTGAKKDTSAKKVKELEKTVADLTAMVQSLLMKDMAANNSVNNVDRDVIFISLCNHILNLSTEPNGAGTVYTFTYFGEEQPIPYSDARRIIRNNKSFIKGGKCYIADDDIIKVEHLTNDYKKILSKDELLDLLSVDRTKFKEIFDTMTDFQKEIFRDVVVEKLYKDKNSVDMNIVQYINESLGIDILKNIDYGNELLRQENE